MTPDRHARMRQTFLDARKMNPEHRAAFIAQACAGDDEMKREVESLLAHDHDGDEFLQAPAGVMEILNAAVSGPTAFLGSSAVRQAFSSDAPPPATVIPKAIGRYRVLRPLGEGGMGVVFLAEQEQPRRQVAVKVVKTGLAGEKYRRRFEHEAEVLGRLQHPGIAAIYEAGIAETGFGRLPFFAMEYVDGVRLLEYSKQAGLDLTAKLQLAIKICETVEHAHQKGIIHRDLKPGNILITASGQPKVLDFGVAKTTDVDMQVTVPATQGGQIVGTIQYMSPEQAAGASEVIDTRSDVYSLGVVFYELICGKPPYDLDETSLLQALAVIREHPPARFAALGLAVDEEVETIIAKSLEKDPARRYQSASALAADFAHYLAGEPIEAKQDSAWYVLRKNARRFKWPLAATATFVLILAASTIVAWTLYSRAQDANDALAWKGYVDRISLAYSAYGQSRMLAMREHLEQAAPSHRGWEWRYLRRLADASDVTIKAHEDIVTRMAFSPDGRWLASCSKDKKVSLWESASGRLIWTGLHKDAVNAIAFEPDGKRLISACSDGTIGLWDTATGQLIRTLAISRTLVASLAIDSKGKMLAVGTGSGQVIILDAATLQLQQSVMAHPGNVDSVSFARSGCRLLSACQGTVRLWAIEDAGTTTAHMLADVQVALPNEIGTTAPCADFCADGGRLLATRPGNTVGIWDTATLQLLRTYGGNDNAVMTAVTSPDGKWLACGLRNGTVGVWDVESTQPMWYLRGHLGFVATAAFSMDGCWLASGGADGDIRIWHHPLVDDGQDEFGGPLFFSATAQCETSYGMTQVLGDKLVNFIRKQALAWDITTGKEEVLPFVDHACALAVSPDGAIAAYGQDLPDVCSTASAGGITVRTATTNKEVWTTPSRLFQEVRVLTLSPDGRMLVTAGANQLGENASGWYVDIREAATGRSVMLLPGHERRVTAIAYNHEGTRLASSDQTGRIIIWDANTGLPLSTLIGHTKQVNHLQFSPDDCRLLSASEDQTCRLWDVATGKPSGSYVSHGAEVNSAAFDSTGARIVSAGGDGTVRIWDPRHPEQSLLALPAQSVRLWATFSRNDDAVVALGSGNPDGFIAWRTGRLPRELIHRRFIEAQARRMVEPLYNRLMAPPDVLEELRRQAEDQPADAELYPAALEYALTISRQLYRLETTAWKVVERPPCAETSVGATEEQSLYERARQTMEYVCQHTPGCVEYLHTLGVAQYRCKRYEEAFTTLTETTRSRGAAHDLAFLAMALHKLGRMEEASDQLRRAEESLAGCDASCRPHYVRFVEEAERLILRDGGPHAVKDMNEPEPDQKAKAEEQRRLDKPQTL